MAAALHRSSSLRLLALAGLLLLLLLLLAALAPAVEAFLQQPPLLQPQLHYLSRSSNARPAAAASPRSGVSRLHSTSIVQSSPEFSQLKQIQVISAANGKAVSLGDTFNPSAFGSRKTIVAFFTHAGDFNTFEFAEKLLHYLPQLDQAGVQLVAVTIGSPENARELAQLTGFPLSKLYCDPDASAYRAYGFSRGFLPDVPVNPYLKLLPMLAGIGSPGTIQAVLRGYVGDRGADASWTAMYLNRDGGGLVDKSAFDVLGTEGARPFEVATVRLQNMMKIIPNWEKLAPANKDLITQQGGCLVFEGRKLVKKYEDKGILTYTDMDDLLATVGVKQL